MNNGTTKQQIKEYFNTSKGLYKVNRMRINEPIAWAIREHWERVMEHLGNSFIGNQRWENFEHCNLEMYKILDLINEFVWEREKETR